LAVVVAAVVVEAVAVVVGRIGTGATAPARVVWSAASVRDHASATSPAAAAVVVVRATGTAKGWESGRAGEQWLRRRA
jgi:hypothetical protein